MNILLLSEQNPMLIGGTMTYIRRVIESLSINNDVIFMYPSTSFVDETTGRVRSIGISIGKVWDDSSGWNYRYSYVKEVNKYIRRLSRLDIVHILHGFFLLEKLDYKMLRVRGVKTLITIHNIPPREGGSSWLGDGFYPFCKNLIFQKLRKALFLYRLKKSDIDYFIVPSFPVCSELTTYINKHRCAVIPHGIDFPVKENARNIIKHTDTVLILTVGGIAPHKNQLLIPRIGKILRDNSVSFKWVIVGPVRNSRYFNAFMKEVNLLKMDEYVEYRGKVEESELENLYQTANLYVHLSYEEGFCLTALDAAAFQLPVVGLINVGEISEIIKKSAGVCVSKNSDICFSEAIMASLSQTYDVDYTFFREYYSWKRAVEDLENIYLSLQTT